MASKRFPIPVMPPYMAPVEREYPMSPRENLMRAFRHEKPRWMPSFYGSTQWAFPSVYNDLPMDFTKDGEDWFGTKYKFEAVQEGHTPVPGLFDDISEWREKMIFPDLDALDWASDKAVFVQDKNLALGTRLGNGCFERLHMCEGFEQALCDILVEQEECKEFFDRLGQYKIDCFHKMAEVYPFDFICNNDDWANAKNSFFSNEVFENTLLECMVKLSEAIHAAGKGFMLHCCGFMEAFLPYIVNDIKADVLEIQDLNNIRMILDKYGAKTSPIYQLDPYKMYDPDFTAEEARAYAREVVDKYGAHTCEGAGALINVIGNKPETYYAFEDELFRYSLEKYKIFN